jgi:FkbM family methyltransferase
MAKAHAIGLRKLTATGLFYLAGGSFTPSCDINSIWWSRKKRNKAKRMHVELTVARQLHRVFPFSQLRTAKWILKRNKNQELEPVKLFGYEMPLKARTTVHVLLSLEGEKWIEDRFLLQPYVRKGMVVLDVGANIGYLTLFFCRSVGSAGAVYAFEPEPDNFRELARTVERNQINWCTPVNSACGSSDREARVALGLNGYVQPDAAGPANCHMLSLDSFAKQRKIAKVDFVKIDVEGFEADVLSGMSEIIKRDRPVLCVEVHPRGFCGSGNPQKVCSLLKKYYQNLLAFRIWGEVRQRLPVWARVRASFGVDPIMQSQCKATLEEVMESTAQRYQLLALP